MKKTLIALFLFLLSANVWAEESGDATNWLADVAARIQLHGYAQAWYYTDHANGKNTNSFLCKRTLLWANAQITPRWSFQFMHDFNSAVQEYYTNYRFSKNNLLTIRFGQAKTGLTLENPLSPTSMETIDVYSEGVTYLTGCGSDPLNGVQYGRDQGIFIFGETDNKTLRYELDIVNGTGINVKDKDNRKNIIGRLEVRPAKGLNLVATGQLGHGTALVSNPVFNPTLVAGQLYQRDRWSLGFDYKSSRFNVHGEYVWGKDGDVTSDGAYLTGNTPLANFKNNTSLDFVWSYDYFNFNKDKNMDMHKVVAGLQYWFFKKCRFQVQYVYKSAVTDYRTFFNHSADNMIMCQMQVRFN